jgi:hypothetical protein
VIWPRFDARANRCVLDGRQLLLLILEGLRASRPSGHAPRLQSFLKTLLWLENRRLLSKVILVAARVRRTLPLQRGVHWSVLARLCLGLVVENELALDWLLQVLGTSAKVLYLRFSVQGVRADLVVTAASSMVVLLLVGVTCLLQILLLQIKGLIE